MPEPSSATQAARRFDVSGTLATITPYGTGHINDTYCVDYDRNGAPFRTILQRINTAIFRNPVALMENIERVTQHLAARLAGGDSPNHRVLSLIATREGRSWHEDENGSYWRMYRFIGGARTFDTVTSPQQAFQAAKAFGDFQRHLVDLPAPRLHDTIPDFHHTPRRFAALARALTADTADRARLAEPEIELALAHQPLASALIDASLPERVTHNDTKFNNVLFDDASGEGICVLDLDTVMPGLALYDFGDMVRTATSPANEDELNLDRVTMQFPMFEALARGYLSAAGSFLTQAEKELLVVSGKLITFEQGIRFLTDYLNGDVYYKVHRPEQNLDRARTQFKLIASMEQQEETMHALIDKLLHEQGAV
jgi:aminoglycoside phosphotransferase (APT) family kinase protein